MFESVFCNFEARARRTARRCEIGGYFSSIVFRAARLAFRMFLFRPVFHSGNLSKTWARPTFKAADGCQDLGFAIPHIILRTIAPHPQHAGQIAALFV